MNNIRLITSANYTNAPYFNPYYYELV